jgi:tRNA threonylcarbamoyladenosine biosynthesis protein TsaE
LGDSAAVRWRLRDAADTCDFGSALARACPPPEDGPRLLFLSGELGAGKTTLAAALLRTLGVSEPVRSPSYALIETYLIGSGQAVHVDCYRIDDAQELELLGLRDYHVPHTLWLVEWPERAAAALPSPDLWVHLIVVADERRAECTPKSAAGREWLERLIKIWPYVINKT